MYISSLDSTGPPPTTPLTENTRDGRQGRFFKLGPSTTSNQMQFSTQYYLQRGSIMTLLTDSALSSFHFLLHSVVSPSPTGFICTQPLKPSTLASAFLRFFADPQILDPHKRFNVSVCSAYNYWVVTTCILGNATRLLCCTEILFFKPFRLLITPTTTTQLSKAIATFEALHCIDRYI